MRKGIIYIIKNKCNDKVYVGQTVQDINIRFKQHLKPSVLKTRGSYKIYNAIAKYGKENFYIETLENDILESCLDEREVYYIKKYNSYKKGYNSTLGADSKTISKIQDIEKLKEMYYGKISYSEIAKYFGVCNITVQRTLRSLGLYTCNKVTLEYLLKNKDIKTNLEMAKELMVNPVTITRAFKKFNIKRGKGCSNIHNPQNQKRINKSVSTIQ